MIDLASVFGAGQWGVDGLGVRRQDGWLVNNRNMANWGMVWDGRGQWDDSGEDLLAKKKEFVKTQST